MGRRVLAALVAAVGLLSACSSDEPPATTPDTPATSEPAPDDGSDDNDGSDGADPDAGGEPDDLAAQVGRAVEAGTVCVGSKPSTVEHEAFEVEDVVLVAVRCRDVRGEARTDLATWRPDAGLAPARVEFWTPVAWSFDDEARTDDLHVVTTSTIAGTVAAVTTPDGVEGPGITAAGPDHSPCPTMQRWEESFDEGVLRLASVWREPCQTYLDQDDAAADPPMTLVHQAGRLPIDPAWTYRTNLPQMAGKDVGFHPLDGKPGPGGSGCNPGSDELPDGIWFAFVEDVTDAGLVVDLACMHLDETKDDVSDEGLDFAIVNDSPRLRTVAAHPDLRIEQILDHSALVWWTVPLEDWARTRVEAQWTWLYVNDGRVTEIHEMWWS